MRTKMDLLEAIVLLLASEQDIIELSDEDRQSISRALGGHALKE